LAEPLATATIAAAKAQGITLSVVADLQAAWKTETGFDNYPQAAVFVRDDLSAAQLKQIKDRINTMIEYVTSVTADKSVVEADITSLTPEALGVPSAAIIKATWDRLNVDVQYASDKKDEIDAFLNLFSLSLDASKVVSK
jgi:hypothetical protein